MSRVISWLLERDKVDLVNVMSSCRCPASSILMSNNIFLNPHRAIKEQELDTPSIEKRFAYTFLQQLITYVDEAHEHMLEFGTCSSDS